LPTGVKAPVASSTVKTSRSPEFAATYRTPLGEKAASIIRIRDKAPYVRSRSWEVRPVAGSTTTR
jgi:hypothetical protein